MESTRGQVEIARARYADTKRAAENAISEHMSRSSRLIRQVKASIGGMHPEMSAKSQGSYLRSLQTGCSAASDDGTHADADAAISLHVPTFYRQGAASPAPASSASDRKPKHMTQAMWISQTSTVHSNLSKISSWEDNVKIPEILLTDPADVLCGKKVGCEDENEEGKDTLSKLLNDTSYEMALEADISNSFGSANLFSQHLASVVNYSKVTPAASDAGQSASPNQAIIGALVGDTCRGLESLTHEWQTLKGAGARIVDSNAASLRAIKESCDEATLSDIDALYLKTFGTRSGLLDGDKAHTLTHALLHINEMDKHREAELAPKMCATPPPTVPGPASKAAVPPSVAAGSAAPAATSETRGTVNFMESINILREDKLGIRLHKMSDFNRPFTHASGTGGTNVEVQTEAVAMPESRPVDQLKSAGKVKVVYSGTVDRVPGLYKGPVKVEPSAVEKAANSTASELVANVQPRLPDPSPRSKAPATTNGAEPILRDLALPRDVRTRREMYQAQLLKMTEAEQRRWQAQRAPLYAQMRLNERCGVRMSELCRGGRRGGSRLTHGSPLLRAPMRDGDSPRSSDADSSPPEHLRYESPSNKLRKATPAAASAVDSSFDSPRVVRGYYGYDDLSEGQQGPRRAILSKDFYATPASRCSPVPSKLRAEPAKGAAGARAAAPLSAGRQNPFKDFDGWWNEHSIPLRRLREQLSIS
ncbi:tol-pal system protein YbgF [Babesia caballi]|uniref:Tol-pal system protein YbgF n=1 Tax=Babesia caballi TaxID=5871 RepID=A0AAV4LRR0_BABCB|nr:tol-pal system protein YbgF [Babesia caballi]